MDNVARQAKGLTQPYCDYFGCVNVPTQTDGEFVMCPHHEKTAYSTATRWRPIILLVPQTGDAWPYYVAEY